MSSRTHSDLVSPRTLPILHLASLRAPASHSGRLLLLVLAAHLLTAFMAIRDASRDEAQQTEPLTIALIKQSAEPSPREARAHRPPTNSTRSPAPAPPSPAPDAPVSLARPPQAAEPERAMPLVSAPALAAPLRAAPSEHEASPPEPAELPPPTVAPTAPAPTSRPAALPTPALAMSSPAAPLIHTEPKFPVRDLGAVVLPPRQSRPADAPAQIPPAPRHSPGPLPPSAPNEVTAPAPPPLHEFTARTSLAPPTGPVVPKEDDAPAPRATPSVRPTSPVAQAEVRSPVRDPAALAQAPRHPVESAARASLASPTGPIVPRDAAAPAPETPPTARSTPPATLAVAEPIAALTPVALPIRAAGSSSSPTPPGPIRIPEGRPTPSLPTQLNTASGPPVEPQRLAHPRAAPLTASGPAVAPAPPPAPAQQAQVAGRDIHTRRMEPVPTIGAPAEPVSIARQERNQAPLPPPAALSTPRLPAGARVDDTGDIVLGGDILRASYLSNPKPLYPSLSRRLGEQGVVTLRVLIDENGQPQRVLLKTSSGYQRLDNAAKQAVTDWKFTAVLAGGRKAGAWVLVPIHFALR